MTGANGVEPDFIEDECNLFDWFMTFGGAYAAMLERLRKNYPKSEIWCLTLGRTEIS